MKMTPYDMFDNNDDNSFENEEQFEYVTVEFLFNNLYNIIARGKVNQYEDVYELSYSVYNIDDNTELVDESKISDENLELIKETALNKIIEEKQFPSLLF